MEGAPKNATFNTTKSCWIETNEYCEWFTDVFVKNTRHLVGPIVLFMDGHLSHISLPLIDEAIAHNIHIICLPPHSSHAWQPLDVGVYGPAKKLWQQILRKF
jgi:hypothetical protein